LLSDLHGRLHKVKFLWTENHHHNIWWINWISRTTISIFSYMTCGKHFLLTTQKYTKLVLNFWQSREMKSTFIRRLLRLNHQEMWDWGLITPRHEPYEHCISLGYSLLFVQTWIFILKFPEMTGEWNLISRWVFFASNTPQIMICLFNYT
jgi:hypothetical protein